MDESQQRIWTMRKAVMDAGDWTAKDVQDLPLADLEELYFSLLNVEPLRGDK